jgi:hypothetical protein
LPGLALEAYRLLFDGLRGRPWTLPRVPAAVVFDMDGVLFDTETLYEQSSLAAARELGFEMSCHTAVVSAPAPLS